MALFKLLSNCFMCELDFVQDKSEIYCTRDGEKNQHEYLLLSNDSVYARIGRVDSGENIIGQSFKMAALCQKRVDTFPKLG